MRTTKAQDDREKKAYRDFIKKYAPSHHKKFIKPRQVKAKGV